jgi:nucleoside-diphosphate-sugar epimerase
MLACTSKNAVGEAYFITDGMDIDWKTFTDAFADEMSLKRPFLSVPFSFVYGISWLMEMMYKLFRIKTAPLLTRYRISNGGKDYYFSIEKAREQLGHNPKVNFKEAVTKTVVWYKNR